MTAYIPLEAVVLVFPINDLAPVYEIMGPVFGRELAVMLLKFSLVRATGNSGSAILKLFFV